MKRVNSSDIEKMSNSNEASQKNFLRHLMRIFVIVPLLIAAVGIFSGFTNKQISDNSNHSSGTVEKNAKAFSTIYAWSTIDYAFTDLNGSEYIDFWVEFRDEFGSQISVSNLNVNWNVTIWGQPSYNFNYSKNCNGFNTQLEDDVLYYEAISGSQFVYTITAGTGYSL